MKKNVAVFAAVLGLSLSTVSGAFAQELDTENPIKIGYVGALSGDTALWGQAGLNGMELTAKQIVRRKILQVLMVEAIVLSMIHF